MAAAKTKNSAELTEANSTDGVGSALPALKKWDRITLTGVSAIGRHGVFDREKREGQPFIVDATLFVDVSPAAASDDVTLTAHYGDVAELINSMILGDSLDLIETLAQRIAERILEEFSVLAVELTVHKPKAPIQVPFGDVSVTVYRERQ